MSYTGKGRLNPASAAVGRIGNRAVKSGEQGDVLAADSVALDEARLMIMGTRRGEAPVKEGSGAGGRIEIDREVGPMGEAIGGLGKMWGQTDRWCPAQDQMTGKIVGTVVL